MVTLQLILAIVAIILVLVDLAVGGRPAGRSYGSFLTPVAVILLAIAVLLPLATH